LCFERKVESDVLFVEGLWRGMSTTVSRAVIIGSVKLACYDEVKLALNRIGLANGSAQQIGAAAVTTGFYSILYF
jgi:hypothetical protein